MSTGRTAEPSRPERLRLRRDFEQVFRSGVRSRGPLMTLYARGNGRERSRLGISVGKAVGIAVERNRIKRRLREVGRVALSGGAPVDLVVRPSRGCLEAPFEDLGRAFAGQLADVRCRLNPGTGGEG